MKSKTLLIAAAALVAGVVSSEAQVYSANIVGYVNVVYPPGTNVFVSTPLTTGNDVITNVIVKPPGGTQVQLWDIVNGSFKGITFQGPPANRHWTDGVNNYDNALVGPGIAYFVNCGAGFTNTYVGSIVANTGVSTNNVAAPGILTAFGELVPFSDVLTNKATVNMVPGGGTQLQLWDPVNGAFVGITYQGPPANRHWTDGVNNYDNYVLNPGVGFFINSGAGFTWTQTTP